MRDRKENLFGFWSRLVLALFHGFGLILALHVLALFMFLALFMYLALSHSFGLIFVLAPSHSFGPFL